jgi:type I restriction enzyme R subunit
MEKDPLTESESKLFEALSNLKHEVDSEILRNTKMMDNEGYVEQLMLKLVAQNIMKPFKISPARTKSINSILLKEYMNEYHGKVA